MIKGSNKNVYLLASSLLSTSHTLSQANKYARDAAVKQMREFTQATQADATRLLKTNSWRLEAAMDAFYSDPVAMANSNKANAGAINAKAEKALREKLGNQFDEYKGQ